MSKQVEYPEGWQRDGNTVYLLEEGQSHTGKPELRNRITIQVHGRPQSVPVEEVHAVAKQVHAALSAPAPIGKEEGSPADPIDSCQQAADKLPGLIADLLAWQTGNQTKEQLARWSCGVAAHDQILACLKAIASLSPSMAANVEAVLTAAPAPAAGASPVGGPADLKALVAVAAELDNLATAATGPTPLASTTYVQALLRHRPALTQAIRALAAPSLLGGGVAAESKGVALIAAERAEQIHKHGWDVKHDADYGRGELVQAAATCLSLYVTGPMASINVAGEYVKRKMWPWQSEFGLVFYHKIVAKDAVGQLKVAGALIAAEIDRLEAAAPTQVAIGGSGHE